MSDLDNDSDFDDLEFDNTSLSSDWLQDLADNLDPTNADDSLVRWKPLLGPQTMAFYSDADELFYGGAAGGGKMLWDNSLLATPFGWKTHGEIKTGDQVCNPDGTVARVIAVHPHPNRETYKLTFTDGASVIAGDEHLWPYWIAGAKLKADRKHPVMIDNDIRYVEYNETIDYKICTTLQLKELLDKSLERESKGKRPYWPLIPLCEPVKYTRPTRTRQGDVIRIDPYLLGLLIGDGTITKKSSIAITTVDQFIVDEVRTIVGEKHVYYDGKKSLQFRIGANLKQPLESYGLLGKKSNNKFIPENYLYASIDTRFSLMSGLIDTDGYVDDRGHVSYTSVSEQLAKDVQQLARSLGAKASITDKDPYYYDDDGNKIAGQKAYTVWMQGYHVGKFMRLPRKKNRYKPYNGGVTPGRRLVNIEPMGKADCTCITVNHPNGLYITDDFIVTHNSDLLLGLALSNLSLHRKIIIFRKSYPELRDIVTRGREILENTGGRFRAGNAMRFDNLPEGRTLELGSVTNFAAAQKYKGRPHDLKLFDEVSDIHELTYTFLIGWARTTDPSVPVRVVAAGNPPTNEEGQWVIRRWSPWLDPTNENPADPGELRWFATLDGEDTEITKELSEEGSKGRHFPYVTKAGRKETIRPKSRTFIPALLEDNPYLEKTDYRTVLQNMPEPFRTQLLYGDFSLSMRPDPFQVIPTAWLIAAEKRWQEAKDNGEMDKERYVNCSFGLDVAETGADNTMLVQFTGKYLREFWHIEVKDDDMMLQADAVIMKLVSTKRAPIAVDALSVGTGLASYLRRKDFVVVAIKGSRKSTARDKTGFFKFANLKSEMWWRLREAFDPEGDDPIAIPKDSRLRSELGAPRFERSHSDRIRVETKDSIKKRIGRSPDLAEATIMAWYAQSKFVHRMLMV